MSPRHLTSVRWLATWFGCGRAPKLPGTVGTLGAIPLVWLFARLGPMNYMYATFAFVVCAILVAQLYEDMIAHAHDRMKVAALTVIAGTVGRRRRR
ncbi:MAG: hypothetical protein HC902_04505 [Calothrix sp. SM1_5_4]|nr:hypothetical protein [Calothrix sp. SM1_5_4]